MFSRFFVYHIWRNVFPYRVKKWNGPNDPIFVDEWDPTWWVELGTLRDKHIANDFKAIVTLVDATSIVPKDHEKYGRCWWRKLWNIGEWPDGFFSDAMKPHFEKFLDKLIPALSPLNPRYETMNELSLDNEATATDDRVVWHKWLVKLLTEKYGINRDRLVFSGGPNWRLFTDHFKDTQGVQCGYYSPHGVVTPDKLSEALTDVTGFPPDHIIFSGDGGNGRDPRPVVSESFHNISVADAELIAGKIEERGIAEYEYWDQTSNDNNHQWCGPLTAMAKILKNADKRLGVGRSGWIGAPGDPEIAIKAYRKAVPLPPPPVMVKVKICTFTNRVANPYCPVVAEVEFPIDIAPTIVCDVHIAPKPKSWLEKLLEWLKDIF
jgi:hypothetical protein